MANLISREKRTARFFAAKEQIFAVEEMFCEKAGGKLLVSEEE